MAANIPEVKPAQGPVSTQGVFRRTASGLIREMSMADHWMYNVFTLLVLTGAAQFYVWSTGEFPATNPVLGLIVAAILIVPIYLAYSMLASAMPRSGGDYIFQSRILHPAVAFTALFALLVTIWYWLELSGFWIAEMTLSPLFSTWGVFVHSQTLLNLGTWFSSNWGIMITTLVTNILIAIAFLPGLKTYLKVQWFLFAGLVISIVMMTIVLLTTSHATFVTNFNTFMASLDPAHTNYYQYVIDAAKSAGFDPSSGGGLYGLIGVVAIAWFNLIWAVWSAMNLGEIKHASNFGKVNRVMQGSLAFGVLVMAGTMALLLKVCGHDFTLALGYDWFNRTIAFPVQPYTSILIPVMGGGVIILILTLLGFLAQAIQQSFNSFIGSTRLIVAMSMDRLLPDGLGKVSRRFRSSPVNAILFILIGAEALAIFFWFVPNLVNYTLSTSLVATIYQSITCLAAAIFPYTAKAIYNASPISKYKIGKIPLLTLCGAWGFIVGVVLIVFYLIVPGLGLASTAGLVGIGVIYVIALIWFWVARAMNKRRGVDIDLNFQQIPPE
jgi:APA family basic amino acid/polyamine antiporter